MYLSCSRNFASWGAGTGCSVASVDEPRNGEEMGLEMSVDMMPCNFISKLFLKTDWVRLESTVILQTRASRLQSPEKMI